MFIALEKHGSPRLPSTSLDQRGSGLFSTRERSLTSLFGIQFERKGMCGYITARWLVFGLRYLRP